MYRMGHILFQIKIINGERVCDVQVYTLYIYYIIYCGTLWLYKHVMLKNVYNMNNINVYI